MFFIQNKHYAIENKFLTNIIPVKDFGLLILRVGFGGSMLVHGFHKFERILNGNFHFADPLGIGEKFTLFLAVFAEYICPLFIIAGYKTKWFSLPVIATMAVAFFVVHSGDNWQDKEMAAIYLLAFLSIFLLDGGKLTILRIFKKK